MIKLTTFQVISFTIANACFMFVSYNAGKAMAYDHARQMVQQVAMEDLKKRFDAVQKSSKVEKQNK